MYIGIDVSKATLAVAQKQENGRMRHFEIVNNQEKIDVFLSQLDVQTHTLVMEYTGTYHRKLLAQAVEKGFSICMVCPRESAGFSRMKNNTAVPITSISTVDSTSLVTIIFCKVNSACSSISR